LEDGGTFEERRKRSWKLSAESWKSEGEDEETRGTSAGCARQGKGRGRARGVPARTERGKVGLGDVTTYEG
jgi:hypothetical protein